VIALVLLTRRHETMGPMVNGRALTLLSFAAAATIVTLNATLLASALHLH
jgi:Mn2+/Fe2+ NRAMP family transporter